MFMSECSLNPCQNGGTCRSSDESDTCLCRYGFTGLLCEGIILSREALRVYRIIVMQSIFVLINNMS